LTLAVGTVKVFGLGSTTVAAVPVASTGVVGVVTVSVVNETYDFAITFALAVFALAVWVEAFALVITALFFRTMQKTGAYITAVAIVPVTTAVVIICVAELVAHPGSFSTLAIALLLTVFLFVSRVQTPAVATISVIVFDTTTVAAVPLANLEVV